MLKKCAFYVRGFMRMSTLVILFILLVTYYFYNDKIHEISMQLIENNKENGSLFYIDGIWNKMKGVQKLQDDRSQNALDLTGKTKTVNEKNGLYEFEIPESWNVSDGQKVSSGGISKITVSNKSFSERNEDDGIYYDNGVQLTVQIFNGELPSVKKPDGGHGKMLIGKSDIVVSGENIQYHKINDSQVKNGKIIDAHILHGGNTYEIRYVYNEEKVNGGEFLFQEIMNSFRFSDKM